MHVYKDEESRSDGLASIKVEKTLERVHAGRPARSIELPANGLPPSTYVRVVAGDKALDLSLLLYISPFTFSAGNVHK